MLIWDIVFILFGTIVAQIYMKNNEMAAPFMAFIKSHVNCSDTTLLKIEELVMPCIGVILILFFVHPQDAMAQITSGAAWNVGISSILNKAAGENA